MLELAFYRVEQPFAVLYESIHATTDIVKRNDLNGVVLLPLPLNVDISPVVCGSMDRTVQVEFEARTGSRKPA